MPISLLSRGSRYFASEATSANIIRWTIVISIITHLFLGVLTLYYGWVKGDPLSLKERKIAKILFGAALGSLFLEGIHGFYEWRYQKRLARNNRPPSGVNGVIQLAQGFRPDGIPADPSLSRKESDQNISNSRQSSKNSDEGDKEANDDHVASPPESPKRVVAPLADGPSLLVVDPILEDLSMQVEEPLPSPSVPDPSLDLDQEGERSPQNVPLSQASAPEPLPIDPPSRVETPPLPLPIDSPPRVETPPPPLPAFIAHPVVQPEASLDQICVDQIRTMRRELDFDPIEAPILNEDDLSVPDNRKEKELAVGGMKLEAKFYLGYILTMAKGIAEDLESNELGRAERTLQCAETNTAEAVVAFAEAFDIIDNHVQKAQHVIQILGGGDSATSARASEQILHISSIVQAVEDHVADFIKARDLFEKLKAEVESAKQADILAQRGNGPAGWMKCEELSNRISAELKTIKKGIAKLSKNDVNANLPMQARVVKGCERLLILHDTLLPFIHELQREIESVVTPSNPNDIFTEMNGYFRGKVAEFSAQIESHKADIFNLSQRVKVELPAKPRQVEA